jgi:hypothetical protein
VIKYKFEVFAHPAEEVGADMEDGFVGEVDVLHVQAAFDPLRQLLVLACPGEAAVGQDHQSVVVLATHDSAQTLGALAHGVELEELVPVYDLFTLDHVPDPFEEDGVVRILYGEADHDDAATVVSLEIYAFCDFASCDGEEDAAPADVAGLAVLFEAEFCFGGVFLFDVDVFVLDEFVYHSCFFPVFEDVLHVDVGREETEYAVGDYFAQTPEKVAIGD